MYYCTCACYDPCLINVLVGIKYIQLRKAGGEIMPESGLFVKIAMKWNEPVPPVPTESPPLPPPVPTESPPLHPPIPTESPPLPPSRVYETQQSNNSCRFQLVHQDEIDVTRSLSPGNIALLTNKDNSSKNSQEADNSSLVNLLDVDPASPEGVVPISNQEVELHVEEEDDDTEIQTAILRLVAEI